ncbi:MAG: hypothetical protein GYB66_09165 [Chloroflexi bacterium]|nr:hypothetical protein [Chloroflexota bacterium]
MADFIPGLELNRRFYHDTIRPLLDQYLPGLAHDAALIGSGSDILGFDTPRSTDHDWGPRAYLFLNEADFRDHANEIMERLRYDLPRQFRDDSPR